MSERYIVKAHFEVHQSDLPPGQYRYHRRMGRGHDRGHAARPLRSHSGRPREGSHMESPCGVPGDLVNRTAREG